MPVRLVQAKVGVRNCEVAMELMDTRVAQVLAVPTRVRLLQLLRTAGQALTASELAATTGLHVNTVRSHLELMVDAGLATRSAEAPRGPGRPQVGYRASDHVAGLDDHVGRSAEPNAAGESATAYRELAAALVNELAASADPDRLAVDAGRRWAATMDALGWPQREHRVDEAVGRLIELLDRLGFAPTTEPLGDRIYLHACPFVELARRNANVVCGVHAGLLHGAVDRLRAPLAVVGVDPFVRENLCLVRLEQTEKTGAARQA